MKLPLFIDHASFLKSQNLPEVRGQEVSFILEDISGIYFFHTSFLKMNHECHNDTIFTYDLIILIHFVKKFLWILSK